MAMTAFSTAQLLLAKCKPCPGINLNSARPSCFVPSNTYILPKPFPALLLHPHEKSHLLLPLNAVCKTPSDSAAGPPNVVDILEERGLLRSLSSPSFRSRCSEPEPLTVYSRFSATSDCLNLDDLVALIVLLWFIRCGHEAFAVVAAATAPLHAEGYPRSDLELEHNAEAVSRMIDAVLGRGGGAAGSTLNNMAWLKDLGTMRFIQDLDEAGVRVASLLSLTGVGEDSTYSDFVYPMVVAYDFLTLFRDKGVTVQVGPGSHWNHIKAGIKLIHRLHNPQKAYGLTFTDPPTAVFGKSLDFPLSMPASTFYQRFLEVPDDQILNLLRTFTFLTLDEIAALGVEMEKPTYVAKTTQHILARTVTKLVHGPEGVQRALNTLGHVD